MRILCIGDVVGSIGCEFLRNNLPTLKKVKGVDFVICNGENSADGNGLTPVSAKHLFDSGVDAITLGNHSFRRKEDRNAQHPGGVHRRPGQRRKDPHPVHVLEQRGEHAGPDRPDQ